MFPTRLKLLVGALGIGVAIWVWQWVSGWGLVTIRADAEPLAKIIRTIEDQGGVRIVTNADTDNLVTMEVIRVPVVDAIDELSARIGGRWSLVIVAAPSAADVRVAIAGLAESSRPADFHWIRSGGSESWIESTPDPRRVMWSVSPMERSQLSDYADQLAQKTGVTTLLPSAWDPIVPKLPNSGLSTAAMRKVIRSVGGHATEVFSIRMASPRDEIETAQSSQPSSGSGEPDWGRRVGNPEWLKERVMAQIATLPPEDRSQALRDFDEVQAFFQSVRNLPPEERRAAIEARMDDPLFQERMLQRETRRDLRAGPDRRIDRYKRYLVRKAERQNGD